jgi:predicted RND superfamily exporter protein
LSALRSGTRRAAHFVDWTLRWGKWVWAVALVLAIPASWRTLELYSHLRTDLEELLPESAPSVVAIDELKRRMIGVQHLGVIVDAGDAESLPAAERFLDALALRVRDYPRTLVTSVHTGDAVERRFLEDHAALYMDLPDLEEIARRIETRRDWEVSRETGALVDDADDPPPPGVDFHDIQEKYERRVHQAASRFDDDRFASRSQHCALLLIDVGAFETGRARGGVLFDRVTRDIVDLHPEQYAPGLRLGFTGDVAISVEETRALMTDLSIASIVVLVLVGGAIVLYFRWWKSLLILLPPLLLAAVFTFALASLRPLRITALNSNTAFLGSILVGNGINFGIMLLARYVEERRRSVPVRGALVLAVAGARKGTLAAALAAGVAYASLALTHFRGFRQFGLIGGLGMAMAWALAFVLTPPLAAWVDRAEHLPARRGSIMAALSAFIARHPLVIVATACALSVGAVWELRAFGSDRIETDFSKLRRADTWKDGEGYWGRRMDALLGTYVTPTVILADGDSQARAIGRALTAARDRPPLDAMVASIRTIDDVVPRDQESKIAVIERLRADLTPKIRASLSQSQRTEIDRLLGAAPLRPVTGDDVPPLLMSGLRERDGTVGRAVLVFPKPGHLLWEGAPLADLVRSVRAIAATRTSPQERAGRVAGSLPLSSDILESIRHDGPIATGAAFLGVVAVVLSLLHTRRATALVIGSLVLGVIWFTSAAMALAIKINFANFIAFPITFGIGVDYAVNMATRWEEDGRGSMAEAVRTTGGAVALCSLTTIIGYSSLLLAENRALFLFGLLAVLGELACLGAAILVLPAFVELVARVRREGARGPSLEV